MIDTRRLRLRIPSLADADGIAAYAADPEVSRFVTWRRHVSIRDAEAFLRYAIAATERGDELHWVVTRAGSEQVLGTSSLRLQGHRAELGYVLGRAYWGQGLATEAAGAIVDWALVQSEIHRVWAVCDIANHASVRVLEKLGMEREGLLRRWAICPNLSQIPRDCWSYSRVK